MLHALHICLQLIPLRDHLVPDPRTTWSLRTLGPSGPLLSEICPPPAVSKDLPQHPRHLKWLCGPEALSVTFCCLRWRSVRFQVMCLIKDMKMSKRCGKIIEKFIFQWYKTRLFKHHFYILHNNCSEL